MTLITLSKIKRVCAIALVPRVFRGDGCTPGKFHRLTFDGIQNVWKSTVSDDSKDKEAIRCKRCKRLIEYAFGPPEVFTEKEKASNIPHFNLYPKPDVQKPQHSEASENSEIPSEIAQKIKEAGKEKSAVTLLEDLRSKSLAQAKANVLLRARNVDMILAGIEKKEKPDEIKGDKNDSPKQDVAIKAREELKTPVAESGAATLQAAAKDEKFESSVIADKSDFKTADNKKENAALQSTAEFSNSFADRRKSDARFLANAIENLKIESNPKLARNNQFDLPLHSTAMENENSTIEAKEKKNMTLLATAAGDQKFESNTQKKLDEVPTVESKNESATLHEATTKHENAALQEATTKNENATLHEATTKNENATLHEATTKNENLEPLCKQEPKDAQEELQSTTTAEKKEQSVLLATSVEGKEANTTHYTSTQKGECESTVNITNMAEQTSDSIEKESSKLHATTASTDGKQTQEINVQTLVGEPEIKSDIVNPAEPKSDIINPPPAIGPNFMNMTPNEKQAAVQGSRDQIFDDIAKKYLRSSAKYIDNQLVQDMQQVNFLSKVKDEEIAQSENMSSEEQPTEHVPLEKNTSKDTSPDELATQGERESVAMKSEVVNMESDQGTILNEGYTCEPLEPVIDSRIFHMSNVQSGQEQYQRTEEDTQLQPEHRHPYHLFHTALIDSVNPAAPRNVVSIREYPTNFMSEPDKFTTPFDSPMPEYEWKYRGKSATHDYTDTPKGKDPEGKVLSTKEENEALQSSGGHMSHNEGVAIEPKELGVQEQQAAHAIEHKGLGVIEHQVLHANDPKRLDVKEQPLHANEPKGLDVKEQQALHAMEPKGMDVKERQALHAMEPKELGFKEQQVSHAIEPKEQQPARTVGMANSFIQPLTRPQLANEDCKDLEAGAKQWSMLLEKHQAIQPPAGRILPQDQAETIKPKDLGLGAQQTAQAVEMANDFIQPLPQPLETNECVSINGTVIIDTKLPEINLNDESVPLTEILRRVRERSRIMYCREIGLQMAKNLASLNPEGKCGDKKPACPPPAPTCPPPKCPPPPPQCPPPPCPKPCAPPPPKCPPPAVPKDPCAKYQDTVAIALHLGPIINTPRKAFVPVLVSNITPPSSEPESSKWRLLVRQKLVELRKVLHSIFEPSGQSSIERLKVFGSRDYTPWTPIPSWPYPVVQKKRPLQCPKEGCPFAPPPKVRPPCTEKPCSGFPKRLTFSVRNEDSPVLARSFAKTDWTKPRFVTKPYADARRQEKAAEAPDFKLNAIPKTIYDHFTGIWLRRTRDVNVPLATEKHWMGSNLMDRKDPILNATTSRSNDEEKLTQKIEVIDEVPLVEAEPKPDITNPPQTLGPSVMTITAQKTKAQAEIIDEIAKKYLLAPVGQIDENILKELKRLGTKSSPKKLLAENELFHDVKYEATKFPFLQENMSEPSDVARSATMATPKPDVEEEEKPEDENEPDVLQPTASEYKPITASTVDTTNLTPGFVYNNVSKVKDYTVLIDKLRHMRNCVLFSDFGLPADTNPVDVESKRGCTPPSPHHFGGRSKAIPLTPNPTEKQKGPCPSCRPLREKEPKKKYAKTSQDDPVILASHLGRKSILSALSYAFVLNDSNNSKTLAEAVKERLMDLSGFGMFEEPIEEFDVLVLHDSDK